MNQLLTLLSYALFMLLGTLWATDCTAQTSPPRPPRMVFSFASYTTCEPGTPDQENQERTELRRRLIRSYQVTPNDALTVDNHFGDVSVALWDRNEMRVEVTVTSASEDADRAKRALDAVAIDEQRTGNTYLFRTNIGEGFGNNNNRRGTRGNSLRIDYRVSMPKTNALTVKNRFGNVSLPNFSAPLTVDTQFGNVYGSALTNAATSIKASFGNVTLRDVQNGRVNMSFGDLDINSSNVLSIVQEYGKLRIGETNHVNAQISYADAVIGAIRQSGKLNMNYARHFRLDQLAASADQLDVVANYSTVALPVPAQSNCDFDVTVTHGGFTYPSLPTLKLTSPAPPAIQGTGQIANPAIAPAAPRRFNARQQYIGRVGTGEGPRIRVVSVFGDVKFK